MLKNFAKINKIKFFGIGLLSTFKVDGVSPFCASIKTSWCLPTSASFKISEISLTIVSPGTVALLILTKPHFLRAFESV